MKQSKYIDEIEELNAADVAQNERLRKKQNSRKTLRSVLIVILSVLCITGIVLIQKLHNDAATNAGQRVRFSRMAAQKGTVLNNSVSQNAGSHFAPLETKSVTAENVTHPSILPNTMILSASSVSEENKTDVNSEAIELITDMKNTVVSEKEKTKLNYSLREALAFKEHFMRGLSCEGDYQKLLQVTPQTPAIYTVLNNLSPYCTGKTDMVQSMREAFLKGKKKALIAEYREKEAQWISYIKAMVVSVVEIRKLNPNTSKPKDILYKAQNELYRQNVKQANMLLRTLPPVMQAEMSDFFREADLYIRADDSLSELIISFNKEGE